MSLMGGNRWLNTLILAMHLSVGYLLIESNRRTARLPCKLARPLQTPTFGVLAQLSRESPMADMMRQA